MGCIWTKDVFAKQPPAPTLEPRSSVTKQQQQQSVSRINELEFLAVALEQQRTVKLYARALKALRQELRNALTCPITRCVTRDPVMTLHGTVYDRAAIEQWVDRPGGPLIPLEPNSRQPMSASAQDRYRAVLIPVRHLKDMYDVLASVMDVDRLDLDD